METSRNESEDEQVDNATVITEEYPSNKTAILENLSDDNANHNGHPMEMAMTTTITNQEQHDGLNISNGIIIDDQQRKDPTPPPEQDLDDDDNVNESSFNNNIPPEFSQAGTSSLFLHSGGGGNSSSVNSSSSTTNNTTTSISLAPISVTPSRKEELLRQAQADRLAWIRKVSLPYNHHHHYHHSSRRRRQRQRPLPQMYYGVDTTTIENVLLPDDDDDDEKEERLDQLWTQDDRLRMLHSSHAVQRLPSVTRILTHLYGMDQDEKGGNEGGLTVATLAARIQSVVRSLWRRAFK
jgi:hypothetical protein